MNSFAWTRQDYAAKSRDFVLDHDSASLPAATPRLRKRQARRFLGCAFTDLVPVAASIVYTGTPQTNGLSGEALSQGQAVYQDGVTQKWWRASANTSGKDQAKGICLSAVAAAAQPVIILNDVSNGVINLGCSVAAGAIYIVSSNLGGIVLYVDGTTPTTGWMTCIVGIAISTTQIKLLFANDNSVPHL